MHEPVMIFSQLPDECNIQAYPDFMFGIIP